MLGEDGEIELAVGEAVGAGLAVPFGGERIIGVAVLAAAQADGEIMHGLDVALLGGRLIPGPRPAEILGDALPALISHRETILGGREARARGALEPARGFSQILRGALALGVTEPDRVLRARIALRGRLTQRQRPEIGGGQRKAHRQRGGAGRGSWGGGSLSLQAHAWVFDREDDAGRKSRRLILRQRGRLRLRLRLVRDRLVVGRLGDIGEIAV